MPEPQHNNTPGQLTFSSDVKNAGWHRQTEPGAFERWHFDALSDDGREALIITFHDNFPLSPRYFKQERNINGNSSASGKKFPAVSLIYSVDGKTILRSVNECPTEKVFAPEDGISFSAGASSFRFEAASYGSGFMLEIDLLTARKRRIKAELEWLSIESDLSEAVDGSGLNAASWNMVAPRSDVSGRITMVGRRGNIRQVTHFRGTGYHDHFRSSGSLSKTVGSRFWGRAHFIDSTAVFHYNEIKGQQGACSKLFLIRDGAIHERDIQGLENSFIRNRYGLKLPKRISFLSSDNIRLRVKPIRVIQSGFFEAKILSEMTLMLSDGKPRKTLGITELITPARMRSRFFRWLADMRIGKNGKGPLF